MGSLNTERVKSPEKINVVPHTKILKLHTVTIVPFPFDKQDSENTPPLSNPTLALESATGLPMHRDDQRGTAHSSGVAVTQETIQHNNAGNTSIKRNSFCQ